MTKLIHSYGSACASAESALGYKPPFSIQSLRPVLSDSCFVHRGSIENKIPNDALKQWGRGDVAEARGRWGTAAGLL